MALESATVRWTGPQGRRGGRLGVGRDEDGARMSASPDAPRRRELGQVTQIVYRMWSRLKDPMEMACLLYMYWIQARD